MNGWAYDYMLAVDDENCPKRNSVRNASQAALDTAINTAVQNSSLASNIKAQFTKDWEGFCDYVTWAYTESVQLQDSVQDKAMDTC